MNRIALLSNININSIKFKMKKSYSFFLPAGYNTWRQELMDDSSDFYKFKPQFCFFIFDGIEIFSSSVSNLIEDMFVCIEHALKLLPFCYFFISDLDIYNPCINDSRKMGFEDICESSWNTRLRICIKNFNNAYRFPLKQVVIENGRNVVYSSKMWYLASSRFSVAGERLLNKQIDEIIRPAFTASKKCLVLDLDNTLWGGVIGEDGLEGIQLDDHGEGARFYDFQKIIKEISEKGVLLALISKNNNTDVEKAFSHPKMILKKENFVTMAVNWNRKSDNIEKIASSLNLGLDSFVFIDDNPVEREEMRQLQPNVATVDFPADTSKLMQFGIEVYNNYFYLWHVSEEDEKKTKMYIENEKRHVSMSSFSSFEDFLVDMNIILSIKKVDLDSIVRASQMTQKTNQFNLTTKKYSEEEIANMLLDKNILMLLGHVQDKYGDNGNSILLIVKTISSNEAVIDSFLMSCRVMNRTIEFGFLYEMENILKEKGIDVIYAKYCRTKKNSPVEMFFCDAGYSIVSQNENETSYRISSTEKRGNLKKSYITIKRDF